MSDSATCLILANIWAASLVDNKKYKAGCIVVFCLLSIFIGYL